MFYSKTSSLTSSHVGISTAALVLLTDVLLNYTNVYGAPVCARR